MGGIVPHKNRIIELGLQDKALALILEGLPNVRIIKELGVSRDTFYAWKRKLSNPNLCPTVRGAVRMELSQENAVSEIVDQLYDYTQNYRNAMARGDEELAGKWANLRTKLGETWVKVTGLDRVIAAEPRQVEVTWHFVTQNPPQN
jgi:transposase